MSDGTQPISVSYLYPTLNAPEFLDRLKPWLWDDSDFEEEEEEIEEEEENIQDFCRRRH